MALEKLCSYFTITKNKMSSATAAAVEDWQVIDEQLRCNKNDVLGSGSYTHRLQRRVQQ